MDFPIKCDILKLCEVDFIFKCDVLKPLKKKKIIIIIISTMEMCLHQKTYMSISKHRISKYCEKLAKFGSNFKNLAQEISMAKVVAKEKKS